MTWDRIGGKQVKKKEKWWSLRKMTLYRPYSIKNKDNIFIFNKTKLSFMTKKFKAK